MKRALLNLAAALAVGAFSLAASPALAGMHAGKQCPMMHGEKDCCCKGKMAGKQCPMEQGDMSCCKGDKMVGKQCPLKNIQMLSAAEIKRSPAVKEYKQAFADMHEGMDIFYTGDVDTDFARGMIPHHQGAVDMAKVVLKYGKDEDIRNLAEWIVSIQNQEIAQMGHWLTRVGAPRDKKVEDADVEAIEKYEQGMHRMHREMDIVYTGDPDVDFVLGMIPHHQGAIDMAEVALKHGKNAEIKALAEGVVRTQNGEIAMMKRWLKKKGVDCHKSLQEKVAKKRGVKHSARHAKHHH